MSRMIAAKIAAAGQDLNAVVGCFEFDVPAGLAVAAIGHLRQLSPESEPADSDILELIATWAVEGLYNVCQDVLAEMEKNATPEEWARLRKTQFKGVEL